MLRSSPPLESDESDDDDDAAAGAGAGAGAAAGSCARADVAKSAVAALMATAESLRII